MTAWWSGLLISGSLIGFLQHAVFFVSEVCCTEPQRSVFFITQIFFLQQFMLKRNYSGRFR